MVEDWTIVVQRCINVGNILSAKNSKFTAQYYANMEPMLSYDIENIDDVFTIIYLIKYLCTLYFI